MRNLVQSVATLVLLASQVQSPISGSTAFAAGQSTANESIEVSLNMTNAQPLVISTKQPNYDAEVLAPLHAAQAKAAAEAAAKAAAARKKVVKMVQTVVTTVQAAATPANMLALRFCEAGNIYTRNSGNGYYGAYQFDIGTWGNWGGYARPDLAPADVQDAKFLETFARRGWSPWPACARKLGFM
ncbi:MAG TPA: transglycosylase family protein [Candidatus Saccharimonadia bacterium]